LSENLKKQPRRLHKILKLYARRAARKTKNLKLI